MTLNKGTNHAVNSPPDATPMNRIIDHTLLKANATYAEINQLCSEALTYHFASVCVNPTHVKRCAGLLLGSDVAVCTVVGFPLGSTTTAVKVFETKQVIAEGATEVDMVLNIGALKSGDQELVRSDIAAIALACRAGRALLKVIIEAAMLTDEEKRTACQLAAQAGADFVKTSTGFGPGGATPHDVMLMREVVGPELGVKAAGGVRTLEDAQKMVAAGANRIGASSSIAIVASG